MQPAGKDSVWMGDSFGVLVKEGTSEIKHACMHNAFCTGVELNNL